LLRLASVDGAKATTLVTRSLFVESVLQAIASGQTQVSGSAVAPKPIQSASFVRVTLDNSEFANRLPAGSTGEVAIFTEYVKAAHIVRRALLRQLLS
jgi:hypothetical protein